MILKQIWNERSANAWIWAELFLVSIALWVVADWLYVNLTVWNKPMGFDITNCYKLDMDEVPSDVLAEKHTESEGAATDAFQIMERLRHHPDVEAVCIAFGSLPYINSNSYNNLRQDSVSVGARRYVVTPDFFRVFRYGNANGGNSASLAETFATGKPRDIVVSQNVWNARYPQGKNLIGQQFMIGNDTTNAYTVVAVTDSVRFFEYSTNDSFYAMLLTQSMLKKVTVSYLQFALRVKDNTAPGFAERLLKESPAYNVGAAFIQAVTPYHTLRQLNLETNVNAMKNRAFIMVFLLVNIFLGIVGTFWYRTQQRRSELGLRVAMGSSKLQLNGILMGEGLLILALAAIPMLIVIWFVGKSEIAHRLYGGSWMAWNLSHYLISTGLTIGAMALMIIIGIWYPAWQAMKIQPADALHNE